MSEFEDNYNTLDKTLHRLAFNTVKIQKWLAEFESDLYRTQLRSIEVERPVFISGLPRCGTTALLNVLCRAEEFCFHTYQDMPFLFTPIIWSQLSQRFKKKLPWTERAHRDGLKINQSSPEAFEEMLWQAFWPTKYSSSISVWSTNRSEQFDSFFVQHIKKMMLREQKSGECRHQRYISKNNLNIARISYIKSLFPDSIVVVPFREPVQHAYSLYKQHQNFIELHKSNAFARSYMKAIGHYDFGIDFKPINFNLWHDSASSNPNELIFWLEYWQQTYQFVLKHFAQSCIFVDYDYLCKNPQNSFEVLSAALQIQPSNIESQVSGIRSATKHNLNTTMLSESLVLSCSNIHEQLQTISVNHSQR